MNTLILTSHPFLDAYSQSDFFGKCIFLSLLFLSIISWVILIYKTICTRAMRRLSLQFQEIFEKKRHHPLNIELLSFHTTSFTNPFLDIYTILKRQTLELLNKNRLFDSDQKAPTPIDPPKVYLSPADIDLIASHLTTAVSSEIKGLDKNLFILSTIVTLGPFLGLLGTVWGILITFSQLTTKAAGQTNEMVLSGLSMALGTTVLGLLVAIPALIGYNFLKNSIRDFQVEMEDFSTLILASIEIQYRKVDS